MPDSKVASRGFTRRNFIKGAALLSAAGAFVGCSPESEDLDETPEEESGEETGEDASGTQKFLGVCSGNCSSGCPLDVHVRDGQIVRTTMHPLPDENYNRICAKGAGIVGRIYGSNRVLYPMKRTGERGGDEFERITWEEALDEITTRWQEITDECGPAGMALLTGTGQNYLASGIGANYNPGMGGNYLFRNIVGASAFGFDVDMAAYVGWLRAIGGASANEAKDILNAKTVVCWGANPAVSGPQTMHFLLEARDAGAQYIVIDPVYNANTAKADWHVPVRAGTDGALAMAMLNHLFENDMIDEGLLKNQSNAPFLIKDDDMLMRMSDLGVDPVENEDGTVDDPFVVWDLEANEAVAYTEAKDPALTDVEPIDGIAVTTVLENVLEQIADYTPEAAAEICNVSADDIRELARVYAEEGPVTTNAMMGVDHYNNAQYSSWPMFLVAALTGNTGISGAGIGNPQYALGGFVNFDAYFPTDSEGNPCQGGGPTVVDFAVNDTIDNGEYAGEPLEVKGCYIAFSNPVCTLAQRQNTIDWMNKLDFIVVADVCMTETAKYADIVLPAAFWFEQDDVIANYATHPYISYNEKAIEPLGESLPDYDIFGKIAEGLGYGDMWPTKDEFITNALDSEAFKAVGCSYEALKEQKHIKLATEELDVKNASGVYPTEHGRIGLYYDHIVGQQYDLGQEIDSKKETQLYWEEPRYAGEHSPAREKYPYHLFSDHMRTRTHSQWWDCEYTVPYEPEPVLRINPDDAAELGLAEGDEARVYNDFGYVVLKVNIHAGLPPKMVSSPRAFQVDEYIDGHYSDLSSIESNQVAANMNYNDVAVAIEKA